MGKGKLDDFKPGDVLRVALEGAQKLAKASLSVIIGKNKDDDSLPSPEHEDIVTSVKDETVEVMSEEEDDEEKPPKRFSSYEEAYEMFPEVFKDGLLK